MTLLLILEREGWTPKGHLGPGQEVAKGEPPPRLIQEVETFLGRLGGGVEGKSSHQDTHS